MTILSRSAEYALRIMSYLAIHSDGNVMRSKDMVHEVRVPAPYLSKILRKMVASGLLEGTKGHGGGFVIARPLEKIRFLDILHAVEESTPSSRSCVFGWNVCSDKNPCPLHDRWKVLKGSFEQWSLKTTLADIRNDIIAKKR